jgi:hypothetical protein
MRPEPCQIMHLSEKELNDLRQEFADMLFEEGGLVCAYEKSPYILKHNDDN